ncbi:MAG: glycoside hydrolase family 3 protein, partial [Parafilimonas sp.]
MKRLSVVFFFISLASTSLAQTFYDETPEAIHWTDSVFSSLSREQRIAQLMVVRLSAKTGNTVVFYDKKVEELINKYNIGAICLFQGNPAEQANYINHFQSIAKTPLLICIDAETGLGMRMTDSVQKFPDQLTLGAIQDTSLIYYIGKAIGEQCRRAGIQVNFAPVVDINNNPDNPVINIRSFGEDKYKVALFGSAIMRGMQSAGIMACAKHFPGHGDVSVDSHFDLPVINKSYTALDTLELYPFKKLFAAGVGSVMIAHLSIPAIDATKNQPTSLSKKNVTDLLRNTLGYHGISFTDALEMQGVAKYYPQGDAALQSLVAGNDMLCLPGDISLSIEKISKAMDNGVLKEDDINARVKKILLAKYNLGLNAVY